MSSRHIPPTGSAVANPLEARRRAARGPSARVRRRSDLEPEIDAEDRDERFSDARLMPP